MSCCESKIDAFGPAVDLTAPKRNNYYFSKMMDVLQFDMEQAYHSRHRHLINRLGIGTGVLCGLGVEVDGDRICVKAGVALDHVGHEVIVPGRYCVDPWSVAVECGKPKQDRPRDKAHQVTLCLGYHECLADYAPVLLTDCRTGQACEAGSIVESFKLWVRDGWPGPRPDFCAALSAQETGYEIVGTIDTGGAPRAVAVAGNGQRAIVMNDAAAPTLQVVDLTTNAVVKEFAGVLTAPLGGVSVAPDGGPALVTHAKGVVVVDLESAAPAVVASFLTQVAYGACVATHKGTRLYAIKGKEVRRIDIASHADTLVHTGDKPDDLAVAADNASVFVADSGAKTLTLIDTGSDTVKWSKTLDAPAQSVAAAGTAAETTAWAFAPNAIRRFDLAGLAQDAAATLDPVDSAFAHKGERVYVVNKATAPSELVVLARADASEFQRIALPAEAAGIATVPGRWRALITHPGTGKVSVVDAVDLRTRICRALSGPCPEPDKAPCVVLATIELLPNGKIGKVDPCTHRTRLLSNEMLLELILCLAEACCGGAQSPPKPPEPEQPTEPEEPEEPRPDVLTQVAGVDFLRDGATLLQMVDPTAPNQMSSRRPPQAFRIHFTRAIGHATIIAGGFGANPATFSLLVQGSTSTLAQNYVPGTVTPDGAKAVIFTVHPEFGQFRRGEYKVHLFCNVDASGQRPAAADTAALRVDGDTKPTFPSGNDTEGGNFTFTFIVS